MITQTQKQQLTATNCCAAQQNTSATVHPDHTANLARLRRVQGQLAGIERMIEERRYCVDILTQLKASASAIKSIEAAVLEKHMRSCMQSAMESKNKNEVETKVGELMKLFLNA